MGGEYISIYEVFVDSLWIVELKLLKPNDGEIDWLNNLVIVHNCLCEKIYHHYIELNRWRNVWAGEMNNSMSKFANEEDVNDDICDTFLNIKDYKDEVFDHLNTEVESTFRGYLPNDRDAAISFAKQADKELVVLDIKKLVHYIDFNQQNAYDYSVQYVLSLCENIKWQLWGAGEIPNFGSKPVHGKANSH